jgi:hypothetical protein
MNNGDYINSAQVNLFGLFTKIGQLSSPATNMTLFQVGYKENILIPNIISVTPSFSFIYGKVPDVPGDDIATINAVADGFIADVTVATDFKKGFNISSRFARTILNTFESTMYEDTIFGTGISYTIPIKNFELTPYAAIQAIYFPYDVNDVTKHKLTFDELRAGANFKANLPYDVIFSIDQYYLKKSYEDGFAMDTKFKTKHFGFDAGWHISKSNYDFAPHTGGFYLGGGIYINNIGFTVNYKNDTKNYDGELTTEKSLSFEGTVSF